MSVVSARGGPCPSAGGAGTRGLGREPSAVASVILSRLAPIWHATLEKE